MRRLGVNVTRVAPWIVPSILVILAFFPTEALQVYLGVPLRVASGELAAAILRVMHCRAGFDDFVLQAAFGTPLLVVPECAGLGKFLLLIALASGLARRAVHPASTRLLALGIAALLAVGANALRLAAVSTWFPTASGRDGWGGVGHECCALIPFLLASWLLIRWVGRRGGECSSGARGRDMPFLPGSVLLSLALIPAPTVLGDSLVPLRQQLERSGHATRIVDSWIDRRGRAWVGIEGAACGRAFVRFERFETIDGSRTWPDLYAVRFARLAGVGVGPIRHLVIDPSIPASGL